MPKIIKLYVRYVDAVNRVLGFFVMYLTLVMMGVLLFASLTRYVFNVPFVWIIELAQFLMVAYYLLAGGYTLADDSHVRMDVFYERWAPRTRAFWDSLTAFCLVFYLGFLTLGGASSTSYALQYGVPAVSMLPEGKTRIAYANLGLERYCYQRERLGGLLGTLSDRQAFGELVAGFAFPDVVRLGRESLGHFDVLRDRCPVRGRQ